MNYLRNFFSALGWLGVALFSIGGLILLLLVGISAGGIPRVPDKLTQLISIPPTEIFTSDGSLLAKVGGRRVIPVERMTESYKNAVIAAEDDQFYSHPGIDKPALLRATAGVLLSKQSRGGSTITQQLAKNLFFSFKKSSTRKFREILAALEIERRFTKDEILGAYCNGIPFGNQAYGIEEAASTFFGVHANDLSLAQSALLAGLPNAPSNYNPYRHPDRAIARQRWILQRMKNLGMISPEEYEVAIREELEFKPMYRLTDEGSYFLEAVLDELEKLYDPDIIYHGGLKVYTTLDPILQGYAINAVQKAMAELDIRFKLSPFEEASLSDRRDYPQAAVVAVETATGAVQALVGGRDWQASQFNRATAANRNMGSSLKPALYLSVIERLDYTPATVVLDSPLVITIPGTRPWRPSNFEPGFAGRVILKYALQQSLNTAAARLIQTVTPQAMAQTIHRLGVHSSITPNYSLALGAASLSAVEMAGLIASIANLGEVVEPYLIRRVEDAQGRVLQEKIIERRSQFNPEHVYLLIDMMKGVMDEGTGKSTRRYGFTLPAIGKTGTTNDYRDSWFIGATPRLSASAWVGFDDNHPMRLPEGGRITGASGALPVWALFMARATEGEPVRDFLVPPGIEFQYVYIKNGALAGSPGEDILSVALPKGTKLIAEPVESITLQSGRGE